MQASSIQPLNAELLLITLAGTGQSLPTNGTIARLQFQAASNQTPAFVPLRVLALVGRESSGETSIATLPVNGRVTVVSGVPLLEALISASSQRSLLLYGVPGTTYHLQTAADFTAPISWNTEWEGTLTNFWHTFDLPATVPSTFYRAVQP